MTSLRSLVPNAETVLSLHPSELAGYVLEALLAAGQMQAQLWHRGNFCRHAAGEFVDQHGNSNYAVATACSAAWSWLEANGFICPNPLQSNDWYQPTRRASEVSDRVGLRQVVHNQQLPAEFLHPTLLVNAHPLFLQSRFDTAVFEAFKELEVAIRTAAGLGHDLLGTSLAARAFNPEDGPLTDLAVEKGERVALMNLMGGSIGSYKNPSSHRHVALSAPEAREMLMLASHLLKIVDQRAALRQRA
ncbi:TIGR02391 family protein [Cognatilysobacter lacus]|uniref:TIGR02391 family protein n=1 Tax=Cognatilysobacter lacus TaxID=1643323 RepID=A0A5D8YS12_9GAMM|nr:TIGR02391 family protein [Lysobacter lacus]TZF85239.1 TIGR02391 family protein [Lysobacter lacus]